MAGMIAAGVSAAASFMRAIAVASAPAAGFEAPDREAGPRALLLPGGLRR
jgi:hypothetical protein